jgi:hypothetical protein
MYKNVPAAKQEKISSDISDESVSYHPMTTPSGVNIANRKSKVAENRSYPGKA